jgi:hypothetical protein
MLSVCVFFTNSHPQQTRAMGALEFLVSRSPGSSTKHRSTAASLGYPGCCTLPVARCLHL